jgi:hypothetical protein
LPKTWAWRYTVSIRSAVAHEIRVIKYVERFHLKMDDKKQTEIPVSRIETKRLRVLLKI